MSEPIQSSPHDALFRHAFTQLANAAGLLRALLPDDVVRAVDWTTLTLHEGNRIDRKLRELESDLVLSAKAGASEVIFYVLVEHQSSPDARMVWRLWQYVTGVWRTWLRDHPDAARLPRVVPIVVYHGARSWDAPRSMLELMEDEPALAPALLPQLTYVLDDLTQLGPDALRARALPAFATLALWALRNAAERSFAQTIGLFRDLFDALYASQGGAEALGAIFHYLSIVTREDEEDLVAEAIAQLNAPVREAAMSLYDRFIQQGEERGLAKGLAQGKAEGKAEGRAEGKAEIVLKLLALKFGALSDDARARVEHASVEELDRFAERVLTAESLDDVLA